MQKKNTLVIWHATMFVVSMLLASELWLFGGIVWVLVAWGFAHGVEFLYFTHNYRYLPVRRDFIPVMFWLPPFNLGCLGIKVTSFFYMDFYKLWGGELRCFCRCSGQRYTLFGPGFFRRR